VKFYVTATKHHTNDFTYLYNNYTKYSLQRTKMVQR